MKDIIERLENKGLDCDHAAHCGADMSAGEVSDVAVAIAEACKELRAYEKQQDELQFDMLVMMGRLIFKLRKIDPSNALPQEALDFLRENDMEIRPTRD
jgi:hypothetical protein